MQFPQRFSGLPEYAFPRLRRLLADVTAGGPEILMTIGEPRHPLPGLVAPAIAANLAGFSRYPPNDGMSGLREAICGWIARRYGVPLDPGTQVLPLNGTREGLFNAAIALCPETKSSSKPAIMMPNPFYQCYGTAALAVGAEPIYVPATAEGDFLPDFGALPPETLDRVTLCYICSPVNPQGAVAGDAYWRALISLAERHDFRILADECYSEIYREVPPPGALAAARAAGADPERVLVFNSLSKRSSAPGLRSGFVAGGQKAIAAMLRLRSYSGAPLPLPIQHASAALWSDEAHVAASRALYIEKFAIADEILGGLPGFAAPEAGFFVWLGVDDGEAAAIGICRRTGVRVLPGAYLARDGADGTNPGSAYVRIALVAEAGVVRRGLTGIRTALEEMTSQEGGG
jgi:N-succinyldiaminopimelate aminotransferase